MSHDRRMALGDEGLTYWDGCRDAVRWYAIYRNGEQVVGARERPLAEVLAEIDEAERRGWPYGR